MYNIQLSPTDLTNGTGPYQVFQNQEFRNYINMSYPYLHYKLIISILLPTDDTLTKIPPFTNVSVGRYDSPSPFTQQFINELEAIVGNYSFDGVDIEYPNKFPCFQATQFNAIYLDYVFTQLLVDISKKLKPNKKILTVTAGQYPISGLDSSIISFAFYLNINAKYASAGIDSIQKNFNVWNTSILIPNLVLGFNVGGIVELINSNNITMDTINNNLTIINEPNIPYTFSDELISDPCRVSVYASWSWKILSHELSPPCYDNASSPWTRGFDNIAQQPYIYLRQQNSSTRFYYVSYEDFQSLKSKLDFVQRVNALGVAIFDITRDSYNVPLLDFIPPDNRYTSNRNNLDNSYLGLKIIVGAICSFILVSVLVAGFIFHRRHKAKMSDQLIDTSNQDCSDISH
ncbi:15367_t:CDS:2 [Cetraspora pellucida]|uniref:15367_t:CDS:1 n=1 Tax=Cetraspora pellucida TaxID=1433469 RepID=A0A9N9CPP8_9GLOM|nr:15367_t:CDS:2 [Cetraspora pellucida]